VTLSLLIAIALPTFLGTRAKAQDKQSQSSLRNSLTNAKAAFTDAQYFNATNEAELRQVYDSLTTELVLRKEKAEVSALFAAGAALLTIVAAALSLRWFGRVP